jgi:Uma2 family endonuclease
MVTIEPQVRRWNLQEYYRMGELGFFHDQRVELIDGEILEMAPQGSAHFACVCLCADAMRNLFGADHVVRVQGPLRVDDESEPEPDIAVVAGSPRDFVGKPHPSGAPLVIEVSDTSLDFDRGEKASLYARAGVADYWIVNLIDRCVEVYRDPVADQAARFGFRFARKDVFSGSQRVKPIGAGGDVGAQELLP